MKRFWIFDFGFSIRGTTNNGVFRFGLCVLLLSLCSTVEAQVANKIPRIGYLTLQSKPNASEEAFIQGLHELGYIDGQTITIEWRRAAEKVERLRALAEELVRLKPALIVARATPPTQAAKNATTTIPIVMLGVADAVGTGFVASLARPGGNITGTTNIMPELAGKRLELLREVLPKLSRVAFLAYEPDPAHKIFVREAQQAAERFAMKFHPLVINTPDEIEAAFTTVARERVEALIVQPLFTSALGQGARIAQLAVKNRLPTISDGTGFPDAGGLMLYGPNQIHSMQRGAVYVDKILKGAKPADLPVQQPTKFELVINLQTARQIGVNIPQRVLTRADRVIK